MRILIAYQTVYPDYPGGVEHRNYQLALALADRGHDVTLAGWSKAETRHDRVRVMSLGPVRSLYNKKRTRSTGMTLRFGADIARLRVDNFDIVETPNMPYIHLPILAAKCRRQRIPLVVTWHEHWGEYWRDYLPGPQWRAYYGIERLAGRVGNTAIAVSALIRDRLAPSRGVRRTVVIPNGIPVAQVSAYADAKKSAFPSLVFAGRFIQEKRVHLLLASLKQIIARGFPAKLVLIGAGPEEDSLRQLADGLGIGASVVFRGQMTGSSYWSELAGSWLAIQASLRDSFGMFPLEAMALGLPVIYCQSSDSALRELIRNGREGLEVDERPESIAAAVVGLLGDDIRRAALSEAAMLRAREYDWQKVAQLVEEEYAFASASMGHGGRPRNGWRSDD